MSEIITIPNPDLVVTDGNLARWTCAQYRRRGWHSLHRIARYSSSFRAARVMTLTKRMDLRIAELDAVRHLTSLPWFSGMVVIHGQHLLFERYAPDFGPHRPHSIQSITKTLMNLIVGLLVEQGVLDLSETVEHYVPEIGTGYAKATLQHVLDMDVVNDYSEDFSDPQASYYDHEEAMGWRLPREPAREKTQHGFIRAIASADTANRSGHTQYKDANTEVLAWVAERASRRPLRSFLADIADAAGLEDPLYITTDREGVPTLSGGASMTARDLARYFSLFVRYGRGVNGQRVGSDSFIRQTLARGVPLAPPNQRILYSNHLRICGRLIMHSGWGGQYAMANLDTGRVAVIFSVIEDQHADSPAYFASLRNTLAAVVSAVGSSSRDTRHA